MLIPELSHHFQQALNQYSQGVHLENLLEAKKQYIDSAGRLNDEDPDFESKMCSFNEWYVFQFLSRRKTRTVISDYLQHHSSIPDEIGVALLSCRFTLFEFLGKNFLGKWQLKDWGTGKKISIKKREDLPAVLEGEIFTGRSLEYKGQQLLLEGVCVLPKSVNALALKTAKKVLKKKDKALWESFLFRLEFFHSKTKFYPHISAEKIFDLSSFL